MTKVPADHIEMQRGDETAHVHISEQEIWEGIGFVAVPAGPAGLSESQIKRLNKAELLAFLAEKQVQAPSDATNAALVDLALPFKAPA